MPAFSKPPLQKDLPPWLQGLMDSIATDPITTTIPAAGAAAPLAGVVGKALQGLKKSWKAAPAKDSIKRDPYGLAPKQDRREFLRKLRGGDIKQARQTYDKYTGETSIKQPLIDVFRRMEDQAKVINKDRGLKSVPGTAEHSLDIGDIMAELHDKDPELKLLERLGKKIYPNMSEDIIDQSTGPVYNTLSTLKRFLG